MKDKILPIFILVITLVALVVDLPKLPKVKLLGREVSIELPLKLGLDLQGGMQLILQTDMSKIDSNNKDDALQAAREVIERRVNLFGVSEAIVQTSKVGDDRRIIVELPGIKDATGAADLVGKTAQLEFRELPATISAEMSEATKSGIPLIYFSTPAGLTGADLEKAQVTYGSVSGGSSGPQVAIEFTSEGANKFAEITKRNIGKSLPIFLDEQIVSAPTVNQEILGGSAVITGQFTTDEAKKLAVQLNAGALPVPIKILEQRVIGPTLGQEAVNKSLVAGIIGLAIVMVYMGLYYGLYGILADIALLIYTAIVLAIFKTGLFVLPPVTLTLAGIAGFILSIGMAVDANILIFERIKEEIRWGKSKSFALRLGFDRAWSSIWASNVSSLITAAILYYFGTSLIKGFAITLAIGVLVSMFTAIVVTRTLLRLVMRNT